jgi:hypothetical protein
VGSLASKRPSFEFLHLLEFVIRIDQKRGLYVFFCCCSKTNEWGVKKELQGSLFAGKYKGKHLEYPIIFGQGI